MFPSNQKFSSYVISSKLNCLVLCHWTRRIQETSKRRGINPCTFGVQASVPYFREYRRTNQASSMPYGGYKAKLSGLEMEYIQFVLGRDVYGVKPSSKVIKNNLTRKTNLLQNLDRRFRSVCWPRYISKDYLTDHHDST